MKNIYTQVLGFLVISIVVSNSTFAKGMPEWLCTQESSERRGQDIVACGVGVAPTENEARLSAFDGAETEFKRICTASADCNSTQSIVIPKRTTCEVKEDGLFECRRLVIFSMAAGPAKPESLKASAAKYQKIAKGMTLANLTYQFGQPTAIGSAFGGRLKVTFNGDFCELNHCYAVIDHDTVTHWNHFKPAFDGRLK